MTIKRATQNETEEILKHSFEVMKEAAMNFVIPTREKSIQLISPFLLNEEYYLTHMKNNMVQGWIGVGKTIDF